MFARSFTHFYLRLLSSLRNLTTAISRLTIISVVFACSIVYIRISGIAVIKPNAVVFIATEMLVERIRSNGADAVFIDGFSLICDYLQQNVSSGDLVITMGAGDIWKVADEYIQRLGKYS